MTLDEMQLRVTALEKLDNAVCTALANDEATDELLPALEACEAAPHDIRASVEAACEHFGYGERMEARTLLTVAHRMLTHVQRPVVVPRPSRRRLTKLTDAS